MRLVAPALLLAATFSTAPLGVAANPEVQRAAAELMRNWSPADQAYSDAFKTIAEGRYGDGEAAFARALEAARAAGWAEPRLAGLFAGRARVLYALGRFAEARADLERALPHEKGLAQANARFLLIDIARAMGDFRTATEMLRGFAPIALAAARANPSEKVRAGLLVSTQRELELAEARNRRAWGDLAGAREMFEQSLTRDPRSIEVLRDLARCRLAAGEAAPALELAHEALYQSLHIRGTTRRRPRDQWLEVGDAEMLACLQTAADCARAAGDFPTADAHYETSAALAQKLGLPGDWRLAQLGRARAWLAAKDARTAEITPAFLAAITAETSRSPEPRVRIEGGTLAGELAFARSLYAPAVEHLSAAVAEIERIRATASFEDKRTYLAFQSDNYRRLIAAHIRLKQPEEALLAAESLKARQLLELLQPGAEGSGSATDRRAALRELQRRLPADVAAISYANADWSRTPPAAIVVTRDAITAIELSSARIRLSLEFLPQPEILVAQKKDVDAVRYGESDEITLGGLIAFYRTCLTCPPAEIATRFKSLVAVSRLLHAVLIEPLQPALGGRMRLLIAPSGLLAYLPFDTLMPNEKDMLVSTHAVTLTPSLLTTKTLADRPPASYERPIIAFGGAIYNPGSYAQDMAASDRMKTQFGLMLAAREAAFSPTSRSPYAGVFGGPMNNLAGTKAEVQMLGELLPAGRIIVGPEVRESRVRELAAAGELKKNRVIHFAVHGASLPDRPELSCIALSYEGHYRRELPAEADGLLQITEIQRLPLRAELVTLSACETGLGAIFAGEGVVGLTTAFLTAGSNRVLASLWPVNDASTTFFMQFFYRRHLINGEPSDLAMAAVKRDFFAGRAGDFRHPQYWAPFNLYGGSDLLEAAR